MIVVVLTLASSAVFAAETARVEGRNIRIEIGRAHV